MPRAFNAQADAQWMDLTGYESNTPTGIAQTVATRPGTEYHLTFWVGNVYDPGGIFGVSNTIKVYLNGVRKLTATNSLHPADRRQAWKKVHPRLQGDLEPHHDLLHQRRPEDRQLQRPGRGKPDLTPAAVS